MMTKLKWERWMTNKILPTCMNQNDKNQNTLSDEVSKFIEKNNCRPLRGKFYINRGLREIGRGEYGTVYLGYLNKEMMKPVVIKYSRGDSLQSEVAIMKRLKGYGIPRVYDYKLCDDGEYMYYQYANKGSLDSITLNDTQLKNIVAQVLFRLYVLHKDFPKFRHNDLHVGNVLINLGPDKKLRNEILKINTGGINCMIHDFGLSYFDKIPNPRVTGNLLKKYGIFVGNDEMYDVAFFLVSVYLHFKKNITIRKFIEEIVPPEYLTKNSNQVFDSRMKPGVNHSSFPSFETIFKNPFFAEFRKPQMRITMVMKKGVQKSKNQIQQFKTIIAAAAATKKVSPLKTVVKQVSLQLPKPVEKGFYMNKNGNLKLEQKKVKHLSKPELLALAKKAQLNYEKVTVKKLINMLEKKYIVKV